MMHGSLENSINFEFNTSNILNLDSGCLHDVPFRKMHNLVIFAACSDVKTIFDSLLVVKGICDGGVWFFFENCITIFD